MEQQGQHRQQAAGTISKLQEQHVAAATQQGNAAIATVVKLLHT